MNLDSRFLRFHSSILLEFQDGFVRKHTLMIHSRERSRENKSSIRICQKRRTRGEGEASQVANLRLIWNARGPETGYTIAEDGHRCCGLPTAWGTVEGGQAADTSGDSVSLAQLSSIALFWPSA